MKKIISILFFMFLSCFCFSQKQDRTWVFGDSTGISFSDLVNPILIDSKAYDTFEACNSISDTSGQILFYLNGTSGVLRRSIYNMHDLLMENGDSIYTDNSQTNGTIILPKPIDNNIFYMFHLGRGGNFDSNIYYSTIDMNQNGGDGKVTNKNIVICTDSLSEKITAIKHANGRDWWIIAHKLTSTNFIEYLVDPFGIHGPFNIGIGNYYSNLCIVGEMIASKEGDKIACVNNKGQIDVAYFNRCTGELFNSQTINDSTQSFYGCSFSQNGNVFFASSSHKLWKYDLTASNIDSSRTLIWTLNGQYKEIGQHELAPDGKIYIASRNGSVNDTINENLTVINNPDNFSNPGLSPFSFSLGGHICYYGLPNMPNYNLGKIPDSPCDTVNTITELINRNFFGDFIPNPTDNETELRYSINYDNYRLTISNVFGRIILSSNLKRETNKFILNSKEFANGIYFFSVTKNEVKVKSGKLLIQHQ